MGDPSVLVRVRQAIDFWTVPPCVLTIWAIAWASVFLAPGWIFGASYDAVAAVEES